MEKIHVLYITDMFHGKGGAEKNLVQLVRGLDRERYEPMVIVLNHGRLLKELRDEGVFTKDLGLRKIYSPRAFVEAVRLFSLLKERRVKVVVTYHIASDLWAGLIARLAGVPVVISSRRDMGYKLKRQHILAYRLMNRCFDRIVAVSEAVRSAIVEKQKVAPHKMITVYNGVEINRSPLSEKERDSLKDSLAMERKDFLVIGATGSIRSVKGYLYFVEAASIVLREYPEAYFLIAGSFDDKPYLAELQQCCRSLGIEKNMIFSGFKGNILQIVQVMDICVSASLSEGMSNAVLEYMSCGKPVVATRAGGNVEVVDDGITGLLVAPGDPRPLARAILALLKDGELRERMGAAGFQAARFKFSLGEMLDRMDRLYSELLFRKEGRSVPAGRRSFRVKAQALVREAAKKASYMKAMSYLVRRTGGTGEKGLRILAYHRVAVDCFDPLTMCLPTWLFERNILHLCRNYSVLSLEQAVRLLREKKLPPRAISLTFDDGYMDNLTNAFPVLARYKVPATIFLSVDAIESGGLLWYDRIVEAFRTSSMRSIDLSFFGLGEHRWGSEHEKIIACRRIVVACKALPRKAREEAVAAIVQSLKGRLPDRLMMDWDHVRYLSARGISFGSHALSHSILSLMGREEAEYEIRESKRLIEKRTGLETFYFANPNGSVDDFNDHVLGVLRQCGYQGACTLVRGINTDASRYTFFRYCMSPGMVAGVKGEYSRMIFDLHLSPLYQRMRATSAVQLKETKP
ncbi:MAG: glycosyltransferase [Deltaproteobacteria bacterium]